MGHVLKNTLLHCIVTAIIMLKHVSLLLVLCVMAMLV